MESFSGLLEKFQKVLEKISEDDVNAKLAKKRVRQ